MRPGRRTVLLVEDEEAISAPLAESLAREGFDATVARTAAEALDLAGTMAPDLVLLDVMLPDGSGFDVCRALRRDSRVPIIMVTARGEEADRIVGLELGADDYVTKPFSAREVVARMRAVLRRAEPVEAAGAPRGGAAVGALVVDPSSRTPSVDGRALELSRKEFDLLHVLVREAGPRGHARAAARGGLGHDLARLDEDARRARERAPPQARGRPVGAALPAHRARRRLPLRDRGGGWREPPQPPAGRFAYVVVLVLVALAIPFALSVSGRVDAEVRGQAAGQAHLVAASAAGRLGPAAGARRARGRAARDVQGRVIVVGRARPARRRLAGAAAARSAPTPTARDRRRARGGQVEQGTRQSETLDEELLYTAVPVVENGRRTGAVRVTRSTAPVEARVRRDLLALAAIGAGALALGLVLAWLLARSLSRPLASLAATARRFGRGELGARAEVAGSSEQRELAASFNEMAARLDRVLEAQRDFVANASHQLRTPLTGLQLRLEAAAAKAEDPALARDLAAAEHETERLARVLSGAARPCPRGSARAARRSRSTSAPRPPRACERWHVEAEAEGAASTARAPGHERARRRRTSRSRSTT